jgi:hypothetical protein
MGLRDELLLALERDPDLLLLKLLQELHTGVRLYYLRVAEGDPEVSRRQLEGAFELCFIVAEQFRSLRAGRLAYPHGVFLTVLGEKAQDARIGASLRCAELFVLGKYTVVVPSGLSGGGGVGPQE